MARLPPGLPADAAPVLAQHSLAEAQRLVRGRSDALSSVESAGYPRLMSRLLILVLATLALASCAPVVQQAGRPPLAFQGPRIEAHRFVSFDGAALGLSSWAAEGGEPSVVIIGLH